MSGLRLCPACGKTGMFRAGAERCIRCSAAQASDEAAETPVGLETMAEIPEPAELGGISTESIAEATYAPRRSKPRASGFMFMGRILHREPVDDEESD